MEKYQDYFNNAQLWTQIHAPQASEAKQEKEAVIAQPAKEVLQMTKTFSLSTVAQKQPDTGVLGLSQVPNAMTFGDASQGAFGF